MTNQLENQVNSYEGEMSLPLQKNLSRSEELRLDQLAAECDSLNVTLSEISFKRTEVNRLF